MIGVEPDRDLLVRAEARTAPLANVEVRHGSAEHLPVEADSVDVVHARFAYFFGVGAEAGLAEVDRVLRAGGTFVAVDNDWGYGQFAELLRDATAGNAAIDPDEADTWWRERDAERINVRAGWRCRSPQDLESILRIEFAVEVVDRFLRSHPGASSLSYGIALFVWRPVT